MPPIPAATRRMRLCVGLAVVGGTQVVAGLATGLAGETLRLTGGRGSHPVLVVAAILVAAGMACGAALHAALAAWHLSIECRQPRDQRGESGPAAWALAQQKMTQIKDLYREAEQMGDAQFSAHWDDLRLRQHELIRQYFEQVGAGGADGGHSTS